MDVDDRARWLGVLCDADWLSVMERTAVFDALVVNSRGEASAGLAPHKILIVNGVIERAIHLGVRP